MQNLIFWYTGLIIWIVIACSVALCTLIAIIIAISKIYYATLKWNAIWKFIYITEEERSALFNSVHKAGINKEEWNKFLRLISIHKANLATMSKGPILHIEMDNWYELNDGTIGKIVRASLLDLNTFTQYEMRTKHNELITIKADGVLLNNPTIRVIKKVNVL
jgi:hypothetical protein